MSSELALSAPEPLADRHRVDRFDCGEASLDQWLQSRAKVNQLSGASRTYVACRGDRVVGYYALAVGGIASSEAPGRVRRNMPDPIPVMVLGRLAVDRAEQGKDLGTAMLKDAVLRTQQAAQIGGIVAIMVHALSMPAKGFYLRRGFIESPSNPMTLIARMSDLKALLASG